jgi:amidase
VGIKPSLGLISQDGIIPVARSQDTAGPIARTITDAAILLGVMQSPFGPAMGFNIPANYTSSLQRGALKGARIGVDRRYYTERYGARTDLPGPTETALATMRRLGATIIDTDSGDPFDYSEAHDTVLRVEFKSQIANYLTTLRGTSLRTLADLIAFNQAHCPTEMRYFGQEIFTSSQNTPGDLNDPQYVVARDLCVRLSRAQGIDAAIQRDNLDAIVAPGFSLGFRPSAVAGYPNISVPIGQTSQGKPAALWMWSGFLQERKLLGYAFDLEQELQPRNGLALFQGAVPADPVINACS